MHAVQKTMTYDDFATYDTQLKLQRSTDVTSLPQDVQKKLAKAVLSCT